MMAEELTQRDFRRSHIYEFRYKHGYGTSNAVHIDLDVTNNTLAICSYWTVLFQNSEFSFHRYHRAILSCSSLAPVPKPLE